MGGALKYMLSGSSSDKDVGDVGSAGNVSSSKRRRKSKEKKVFVVSVQPCFDKKLEASRRDFLHQGEVQQRNENYYAFSTRFIVQYNSIQHTTPHAITPHHPTIDNIPQHNTTHNRTPFCPTNLTRST
jgi:hypothetical protein